jgi:type 1 fimbria pilin
MKRRLFILSLLLGSFWLPAAHAYTYWCNPTGGTHVYSYDFGNKVISNPDEDNTGQVYIDAYRWDLGSRYAMTCDCADSTLYETYFYTETALRMSSSVGGRNYYSVSDYLSVATEVWIDGNVNEYFATPFPGTGISNKWDNICGALPNVRSGSRGKLSLRIDKPFIGFSKISSVKVIDLFASQSNTHGHGGNPVASVYISGSVTVPQTCTINAGEVVTIDFGDIWAGKFSSRGNKPDGLNEKTVTFPVSCNGGVESTANLTVRFQSQPDTNYPDAIKSTNKDVGVIVTDTLDRIIKPNTGLIPFSLNNHQATVSFKAYPVNTTGKTPQQGIFTSIAYIRVDFA